MWQKTCFICNETGLQTVSRPVDQIFGFNLQTKKVNKIVAFPEFFFFETEKDRV